MKGVVLCGGLGKRLYPLTQITNKHLLPIYDRPMVYYPIQTLVEAGIEDIMIVTGGTHAGDFLKLLGNGEEFGRKRLHYAYQKGEGGIAEALGLAKSFIGDDKVIVILGDNILHGSIKDAVNQFEPEVFGAMVLLWVVEDPTQYGIAKFEKDKLIEIVEKPKEYIGKSAVIGVYMYDNRVFDIIETLKPSDRGELEITDVNNAYLKEGTLEYNYFQGWWIDAGSSIDSLLEAGNYVKEKMGGKANAKL